MQVDRHRVDRGEGEPDFRLAAFRQALEELQRSEPDRARSVLMSLSDPTKEPIAKAPGKGAVGRAAASVKELGKELVKLALVEMLPAAPVELLFALI